MKRLFAAALVASAVPTASEAQVDQTYTLSSHQIYLGNAYCNEENKFRGGVKSYNAEKVVCNDTSEKNYSDISKDLARATERRQREWERERRQEERKREAFRRQSQRTAEACVRNPESRSCQNRLTNSIMDGVFGR